MNVKRKTVKRITVVFLFITYVLLLSGCVQQGAEKKEEKVILVTAFEPFGGEEINPAELILEKLPEEIGEYRIDKLLLPVEFVASREIALAEYDQLKPDAVIMLGQKGGADAIAVETTGVNLMNAVESDGSIDPDNAGYAPDNEPLVEDGADKLYSTFAVEEIVQAVNDAGVKCEESDDAGQYVCNALLYSMLEHNNGEVPTGFIHVPFLKEQAFEEEPYMELDDMVQAIVAAIKTVKIPASA